MKPHDRRIDAKLYPSYRHFIILISQHMTTDIMAPPTISYIRSRKCKIGLKIRLRLYLLKIRLDICDFQALHILKMSEVFSPLLQSPGNEND